MRFSLQELVQQTLAEAVMREKLAAAEDTGETKPGPEEKTEKKKKSKETEEQAVTKTSSFFVEKLANAVEYLNYEIFKVAADPGDQNLLPNNEKSPTPGRQSYETGEAKTKIPLKPRSGSGGHGQTAPETALETNIDSAPKENWKVKEVLKQAAVNRVLSVMDKLAGEDVAPAHISAAHHDVPPDATPSEMGVPPLPPRALKQKRLINTIEAALGYTKGDAKAEPKLQMGEVLDEPAQERSTDPVLHNNLDAASRAGVKLSSARTLAARAYLQKLAEEGSNPDAPQEIKEKAERLKELLKRKMQEKKEKESCLPLRGGY